MSVAGSQSNLAGASALEATVCGGPVLVRPAGGHVGGRTTSPKPAWLRVQGREGVLFIAGVILLWQLVSAVIPFSGHYLFPSPLLTARTLWVSLPELLVGTGYSFLILAPSLALAITLGVIWGMLVGTAPALNRMFSPFARFVSPVPPTIYIPYAIVLLPTFRSAAGFVVFIGVFWPVFLNTCSGAATLPRHYRDNARILGLRRGEYLRRVVFPANLRRHQHRAGLRLHHADRGRTVRRQQWHRALCAALRRLCRLSAHGRRHSLYRRGGLDFHGSFGMH